MVVEAEARNMLALMMVVASEASQAHQPTVRVETHSMLVSEMVRYNQLVCRFLTQRSARRCPQSFGCQTVLERVVTHSSLGHRALLERVAVLSR